MKDLKIIVLTFFFVIGVTAIGCVRDSCHGVDFTQSQHFDIQGITATGFADFINSEELLPDDTIAFNDLDFFFIDYLVDYHAFSPVKRNWSFSLIPTAYACSIIPGTKGSKEESFVSFSITTVNDFDSAHLANSSIIDLFDYHGGFWNPRDESIPLSQFLDEQTGEIQVEDMFLKLKKAPELNQEFQLKVKMELSTGEVYEADSPSIIIMP